MPVSNPDIRQYIVVELTDIVPLITPFRTRQEALDHIKSSEGRFLLIGGEVLEWEVI